MPLLLLLLHPSRYGLLNETQDKLDYVLALSPQDFLERRLQTLVFKQVRRMRHSTLHSVAQHAAQRHPQFNGVVKQPRRMRHSTARHGC